MKVGIIILQAQMDDNGDKRFDEHDNTIPMIVDFATGNVAKETFNPAYIDSLKSMLTKIWKTTKK